MDPNAVQLLLQKRDAVLDDIFLNGSSAAVVDDSEGTATRCPYPEDSVERHWWTRGYSYRYRILRALKAEIERDRYRQALEHYVDRNNWYCSEIDIYRINEHTRQDCYGGDRTHGWQVADEALRGQDA